MDGRPTMLRAVGDYTLGVVIVVLHLFRIAISEKYGSLPR
jgi:hypothetical protein